MKVYAVVLLVLIFGGGCEKNREDGSRPAESALVQRGKTVYMANCIACHNLDPHKDGSLAPAIANSSLELLSARVLEGSYPPGYAPKRPTKLMVPLAHLKENIPAMHAFLNQ